MIANRDPTTGRTIEGGQAASASWRSKCNRSTRDCTKSPPAGRGPSSPFSTASATGSGARRPTTAAESPPVCQAGSAKSACTPWPHGLAAGSAASSEADAADAAVGVKPQPAAGFSPGTAPHGYDVICLPVISWDSRFQRPQQLMQQFALRGHRVFYASLGFHRGTDAQLAPDRPSVFR